MNTQSGNKVTSHDSQKDELNEQDLNKVSGGMEIGGFNGTPLQGPDTNGVPSPIVVPTHTNPFRKG